MGEKDVSEKMLEAYNDVFADIVNVLVFGGKEVVRPDELEDQTPRAIYKAEGKLHELERDVAKRWKNGGVRIACIGFENQTAVDSKMPLRVIGYDGAEYRTQLSNKKGCYPVVTLVLYYGDKHWNKPLTLKECFDIPDGLQPFVNDYKINLFEIAYLSDEQVNLFKSDFRFVADCFTQIRKNGYYAGSDGDIVHVREVLHVLSLFTGNQKFDEYYIAKKGEVPRTMRKIIRTISDEEWELATKKGEASGEAKGEAKLAKLIDMLLSKQDYDSVSAVTKDAKVRESYYKKYGIA